MKKLFYLAAAITVMASCTSDNLVDSPNVAQNGESGAIVFGSTYSGLTRADHVGADAAALLGENFVVEGVKSDGGTSTKEVVFDHYNVNWATNTANTTTSNSSDWEYVAQTKHAHAAISAQSIKYWDYAKSQYDFIAYSAGSATAVFATEDYDEDANVLYTQITPATMTSTTGGAYTVKGKAENLAKVYIADLITIYRDKDAANDAAGDYNKVVNIKFRSLSAKVRVALYETVPGYSIQASSVKFYSADDATPTTTATLYTKGSDVFNEKGTYTVYYPTVGSANKSNTDYNKAHISFAAETSGTATVKGFGTLDITNTGAVQEGTEATGKLYLGRASNAATYAGVNTTANPNYYTVVIPNETGAVLNLKVDYTLLSTDGSGETINVTGATAQVPSVYATWKSGYAYTYIFKISQNTNGLTNPAAGPAGLYPITFDATVVETEDGIQETITTVADPSITTYAKGKVVVDNDEYTTGSNIYAVVENGTALTVGTNANLYTVTLTDTDDTDAFDKPAQTINEASVANALAQGGTVTDANKWQLKVTAASGLTAVTEIAATDSPNGNAITVNGAKFTPSAAGIYAFEYINGTDKYYKIIKVVAAP